MKIGVDATVWFNQRGYGRHARALLTHLVELDRENEYILIYDFPSQPTDIPAGVILRKITVAHPTVNSAAVESRRSILDLWRVSRAMSSSEFDLLLFPTVYSYVPVWGRARKIVMIHDIIPERFPGLTLPTSSARFFWRIKSALARSQADAIVTVSDYSKEKISSQFRIPPQQIFIVGEAADPVFHKVYPPEEIRLAAELQSLSLTTFLIFIGGFGPHKNLDLLISVFSRIAAMPEYSELKLVMIGEFRKEAFYSAYSSIKQQIASLGLFDKVVFTGYLADEQINSLLNLAQCLVLPSLMEGFGLPAVEAAACGCPVVATRESPLPRLLGEAGIYFDPLSPEGLEEALLTVLRSAKCRKKMGQAGLAAAQRLTWKNAALEMKHIIDCIGAR